MNHHKWFSEWVNFHQNQTIFRPNFWIISKIHPTIFSKLIISEVPKSNLSFSKEKLEVQEHWGFSLVLGEVCWRIKNGKWVYSLKDDSLNILWWVRPHLYTLFAKHYLKVWMFWQKTLIFWHTLTFEKRWRANEYYYIAQA